MTKLSLSGNTLKIIASIFMLIDHIGYFLFPDFAILRIAGRISFPIFAFMIAEGCRYTKSRLRYFLTIFILAILMQAVFFVYTKGTFMNIFFTLSFGILLIYSLSSHTVSNKEFFKFLFTLTALYVISLFLKPDYGFLGCILPLFANFCINNRFQRISIFGTGLILLSLLSGGIQIYCLLALPLLMLYNGQRGKLNLKYFFYAFYPTHLIILYFVKEAITS